MALIDLARRLRRAAAPTRARTRLLRRLHAPAAAWPAAPADLGLAALDLTGRTVLDVGPPSPAVAAAAARAGAVRTVAAANIEDGSADVVVLRYLDRLADPAGAVFRLRERAAELVVIEAPATELPGHEQVGLIEILPGGNWAPSADGLRELFLAAGFTDVRLVSGPPPYRRRGWRPVRYRAVIHARP